MKKLGLIFGTLVLASSLAACQQNDDTGEPTPAVPPQEIEKPVDVSGEQPSTVDSSNQGIVGGSVEPLLIPTTESKGEGIVVLDYIVKNQTEKPISINFNSGLEYDFLISNEKGEKVYQHSENVMSTMMLSTKEVAQGESLTYKIETPKLEKGKYIIEVWTNVGSVRDFATTFEFEVQ